MTDLHCHILPGIDDGAKDTAVSLELLRREYEDGVRNIAFTSHFNSERTTVEAFTAKRQAAFEQLTAALEGQPMQFDFKLGAEVFFSPGLCELDTRALCMGDTAYLLLEFPTTHKPHFIRQTLYQLQQQGIVPLIAHIERYPYVLEDPTLLYDWVAAGAYAQINAGALLEPKLCKNCASSFSGDWSMSSPPTPIPRTSARPVWHRACSSWKSCLARRRLPASCATAMNCSMIRSWTLRPCISPKSFWECGSDPISKEKTARAEEYSARAADFDMKKNKVLKIVLIVLGTLVALLAAAVLGVLLYLRSMAASLPETLPDAPADSTQFTLTDDDLDKLLSGEITLEELTGEAAASSGGEQEAAASAPQEEAGSAASSGSSGSQTESSNASSSGKKENTTGTSGSSTASAAEKPASSSGKQEAAYETEVKALLKQLYSVKARAESELNSCIAGAKAEYKALPESQQTQARKISIALARSGRLYAMQASYDKEVENIVSQMRTVLTANGQSTALADQAMASYKAQKSAMYSQLTAKLYS